MNHLSFTMASQSWITRKGRLGFVEEGAKAHRMVSPTILRYGLGSRNRVLQWQPRCERQQTPADVRSNTTSTIGLFVFLGLCYLRLQMGSYVTATSVDSWYRALNKASFNPPNAVFTPVWIVLFFLMAVAGWRVWRQGNSREVMLALALFTIQLGMNFLWSVVFFGFQRVGLALGEMLILFATVAVMTGLFWRIDRWAALLMAPYIAWLLFATLLTAYIWALN
jgi:translocator protein